MLPTIPYLSQIKLGLLIGLLIFTGYLYLRVDSLQKDKIILNATISSYQYVAKEEDKKQAKKEEDSKKILKTVTDSYEYRLNLLKEYYASHSNTKYLPPSGLRGESNSSSSSKKIVFQTTTGTPTTTSDTQAIGEIQVTEEDAAKTTLMLESLQDWVIKEYSSCIESN